MLSHRILERRKANSHPLCVCRNCLVASRWDWRGREEWEKLWPREQSFPAETGGAGQAESRQAAGGTTSGQGAERLKGGQRP